jgi:hypothetical protein
MIPEHGDKILLTSGRVIVIMWSFFTPNIERLKTRHHIPGLIKALSWKNDTFLHGQAARALGEIGDARAVESLIELFRLDEYHSDDAAHALEQIARRLHNADITTRLVKYFIEVLKPDGLVYSGRQIHYDGDDSEFNWVWASREDSHIRQECRWNEGASRRALAAHALGTLRDPLAVEALSRCLKTHGSGNDIQTRLAVVIALGEMGDPGGIEPLEEALKDLDDKIRAQAAEALARLGQFPPQEASSSA